MTEGWARRWSDAGRGFPAGSGRRFRDVDAGERPYWWRDEDCARQALYAADVVESALDALGAAFRRGRRTASRGLADMRSFRKSSARASAGSCTSRPRSALMRPRPFAAAPRSRTRSRSRSGSSRNGHTRPMSMRAPCRSRRRTSGAPTGRRPHLRGGDRGDSRAPARDRACAPRAPSRTRRWPRALIPWAPLARLFEAFAGIRGVGFSKMTKALHKKRPALIPMLDSVVQAYLASRPPPVGSFGRARDRARPRATRSTSTATALCLRAVRAGAGATGPLT